MKVNFTPKKGREFNSGNSTPRSDNPSILGGYFLFDKSVLFNYADN